MLPFRDGPPELLSNAADEISSVVLLAKRQVFHSFFLKRPGPNGFPRSGTAC